MSVTRYAMLLTLFAAIAAPRALACSCITGSVKDERKQAALVFVGRAVEVGHDWEKQQETTVTFEVYQAWQPRAARTVKVVTGFWTTACGYIPEKGGMYLIFVHRDDHQRLTISLCSNNRPLLCAQSALRELGRPAVRHRRLPDLSRLGSDEQPLTLAATQCASAPKLRDGANLDLPEGVQADISATVLRDGSVRDVEITLRCTATATPKCTPELENRVRRQIESSKYEPAQLNGRPVAMRIGPVVVTRARPFAAR